MSVFYISPAGNDTTGNGSSATPWATISKAHTSAASGDTIICKTGTIAWADQTFTKSLTIQGEARPVYSGSAWTGATLDAGAGARLWIISASVTVTISDLIFRNATCVNNQTPLFRNSGAAAALSFTRCIFTSLTLLSTSAQGGIYKSAANNNTYTFNTCVFYGNTYPADGIFNNFSTTGIVAYFYNTIVYGANQIFGNLNLAPDHTITAKNCIFQALSSTSFVVNASTWTFIYNTTYNYTSVPSGSNNLTSDPLFVAPASGDFRLRPGSPCVNNGIAL